MQFRHMITCDINHDRNCLNRRISEWHLKSGFFGLNRCIPNYTNEANQEGWQRTSKGSRFNNGRRIPCIQAVVGLQQEELYDEKQEQKNRDHIRAPDGTCPCI